MLTYHISNSVSVTRKLTYNSLYININNFNGEVIQCNSHEGTKRQVQNVHNGNSISFIYFIHLLRFDNMVNYLKFVRSLQPGISIMFRSLLW
jgi:hypothetical protein